MKTFGQKLKKYRILAHKTQAEVARATGIRQSAISAYEHDSYLPNAVNLRLLCNYFDLYVADLDERFRGLENHSSGECPLAENCPMQQERGAENRLILQFINRPENMKLRSELLMKAAARLHNSK